MFRSRSTRLIKIENCKHSVFVWYDVCMYKIYFACSIRGGRNDADKYALIAKRIKQSAQLLTKIFADKKLTADGMNKSSDEIWKIDTELVRKTDALIAEVTNPSLGVGYEIAKAEEWGKPVLALFNTSGDKKLSAMIEGSPSTKTVKYTTIEEAYTAIDDFIDAL